MKIALISSGNIVAVGHYRELFPHVSFTANGPEPAWMSENSALPVSEYRQFDPLTQRLEPCPPYVDNGVVYTVTVRELSAAELSEQEEGLWATVRAIRNEHLARSDWTHTVDSPLSIEQKTQWAEYRQALRDITSQPDPRNLVWPEAPGA